MNSRQLQTWVDLPETHRLIVGDYEGRYALGVLEDPPAFVLRVESKDVALFPRQITLHGIKVPVIVQGNFQPPKPLTARR